MLLLRLSIFTALAALIAWGCLLLGQRGAATIETLLQARAEQAVAALDLDWATLEIDGLRLYIDGHAPDPFAQELARITVAEAVALARVIDRTSADLPPPPNRAPLAVSLLRSGQRLTLTGQFHGEAMRARLIGYLETLNPALAIHDLSGTAAMQPPADWGPEIPVAAAAAALVPRARVEMVAGRVSVRGVPRDAAARTAIEARLLARAGASVALDLDLVVPPDPIVPFAFALWKDDGGALRLGPCAARSAGEAAEIAALLRREGLLDATPACPVGLGGPTGDWVGAIGAGLEALAVLPGGRLSLEYRDLRLSVPEGAAPEALALARARLDEALPPGYEANITRTAEESASTGAERLGLGQWLRLLRREGETLVLGRVSHAEAALAVETLAAAAFGREGLRASLQIGKATASADWLDAALTTIETVAVLESVDAVLTPDRLLLRGRAFDAGAVDAMLARLGERLPNLRVQTAIETAPPPPERRPEIMPADCAERLNALLGARAVTFAPGSAVIDPEAPDALPEAATLLRRCPSATLEIGGHTDAQGRAEFNQRLSRARAEAVRAALVALGVEAGQLRTKGYGETVPIADNATPEGRAKNRRIEFRALAIEQTAQGGSP
ncbi:MAG: OmpA family protein [Pseudomonadota bacterium]